jgi:putative membrane protein
VRFLPWLIITWLTNCVGLLLAAWIIGPIDYEGKASTLLLAGLVLGVVNFALRPLLILLTLPFVILTFGLFLLLINAFTLWLTSKIVSGLSVGGFWSTLGGALILSVVNLTLKPWAKGWWKRRDQPDGADQGGGRWYVRIGRSGGS